MENKDIAIIGAGVAGLTAGLYAARSGMKTIIFDDVGGGGQVLEIDNLENYPGVFPAVNGAQLIDTLVKQSAEFGAELVQTKVISIEKKENFFFIETANGTMQTKALIYATGAAHKKLGAPGEAEFEGKGVSYCAVCDGPFFRGKNVVVVGGGDSACSEALYLANLVNHIDLIHRREELRATKTIADRILSNEKIKVHFDSKLKKIEGEGTVKTAVIENVKTGETENLSTDAVFVFVGMAPRTALIESVKKDAGGYFITDEKMATEIPGLFIAGDVRSKPLRQIVTASSDGAIAAFSAAEYVKNEN